MSFTITTHELLLRHDRGLHLELDLPLTGIVGLEDRVDKPLTFDSPFCEQDDIANQKSHFELYYASQVALWRICANLHNNINDCKKGLPQNPCNCT